MKELEDLSKEDELPRLATQYVAPFPLSLLQQRPISNHFIMLTVSFTVSRITVNHLNEDAGQKILEM